MFPLCDKPTVHAPASAVYRFASSILSLKRAARRKNRLSFQEIHLKFSTQNEAGCVGNCVEFPNFFLYPLFLSDLIIEALSSHYLDIRSQAKRWRNLCTSFYYCHPAHFEPRRTEIVGKFFGGAGIVEREWDGFRESVISHYIKFENWNLPHTQTESKSFRHASRPPTAIHCSKFLARD